MAAGQLPNGRPIPVNYPGALGYNPAPVQTQQYIPRREPVYYYLTSPAAAPAQPQAVAYSYPTQAGVPIPLTQAPSASIPVYIQQPASQPPAQMVIVQGAPAAAAAPQAMVPQIVIGNNPLPIAQPQQAQFQGNPSMGLTRSEAMARNEKIARANNVGAPQDFKPADDNPNRLYWCREPSNEFTLRDRRTIDQLDCRWYMTPEGAFYAVKQA